MADHQVTDNPIQPTAAPVLYAQDYGFDHGFVWYRGHFTGTGDETSISLTADTGPFGSFAVWLNGHYLGAATTPTTPPEHVRRAGDPDVHLPGGRDRAPAADNVISVLAENMGQDESFENSLGLDSDKTPRGLECASARRVQRTDARGHLAAARRLGRPGGARPGARPDQPGGPVRLERRLGAAVYPRRVVDDRSACPTRGPRARCRRAWAGTARTFSLTSRTACGHRSD